MNIEALLAPTASARYSSPTSSMLETSDLILGKSASFTYYRSEAYRRKGFRNGNYARLSIAEKSLLRCAIWVTKVRGKIRNTKLMAQVLLLTSKLVQTFKDHIVRAGTVRARQMLSECELRGISRWAQRLMEWLHDSSYVLYLGVLQVNG